VCQDALARAGLRAATSSHLDFEDQPVIAAHAHDEAFVDGSSATVAGIPPRGMRPRHRDATRMRPKVHSQGWSAAVR